MSFFVSVAAKMMLMKRNIRVRSRLSDILCHVQAIPCRYTLLLSLAPVTFRRQNTATWRHHLCNIKHLSVLSMSLKRVTRVRSRVSSILHRIKAFPCHQSIQPPPPPPILHRQNTTMWRPHLCNSKDLSLLSLAATLKLWIQTVT